VPEYGTNVFKTNDTILFYKICEEKINNNIGNIENVIQQGKTRRNYKKKRKEHKHRSSTAIIQKRIYSALRKTYINDIYKETMKNKRENHIGNTIWVSID